MASKEQAAELFRRGREASKAGRYTEASGFYKVGEDALEELALPYRERLEIMVDAMFPGGE